MREHSFVDTTLYINQKETAVRAFYEVSEEFYRTDYGSDVVITVLLKSVVAVKDVQHPPKTPSMGKDIWGKLKPYQEQKLHRIAVHKQDRSIN